MRSLDLASMSQQILKESHVMLLILMLCGTGSSSISAIPLSCDLFPALKKKHDSFSWRSIWGLLSVLQYNHISDQPFTKSQRGHSGGTIRHNYAHLYISDGKYWKRDEIPDVTKFPHVKRLNRLASIITGCSFNLRIRNIQSYLEHLETPEAFGIPLLWG